MNPASGGACKMCIKTTRSFPIRPMWLFQKVRMSLLCIWTVRLCHSSFQQLLHKGVHVLAVSCWQSQYWLANGPSLIGFTATMFFLTTTLCCLVSSHNSSLVGSGFSLFNLYFSLTDGRYKWVINRQPSLWSVAILLGDFDTSSFSSAATQHFNEKVRITVFTAVNWFWYHLFY